MKQKKMVTRDKWKASLLIINLITSIIAFSFIISSITSEEEAHLQKRLQEMREKKQKEDILPKTSSTYNPTGVREYVEYVFGTGSTAPKGSFVVEVAEGKYEVFKSYDNIPSDLKDKVVAGGTEGIYGLGHSVSGIISGFMWAYGVSMAIKMLGGFLGLKKETTAALSNAAFGGILAGKSIYSIFGKGGYGQNWISPDSKLGFLTKGGPGGVSSTWATYIGIAVAVIIFISTYKKESQEIVTFECNPWDAPTGGAKCEECNKQGILPCSEYQCRSLGQSCQLLNPGTGEEKCAWVNRKDVAPPEIKPWNDALLPDYKYNPDNTISPPDRSVKIEYAKSTTGCIKAFSPFIFGIITNEPAKCKIDYNVNKANFSDMQFWFGGSSTFKYNHSQMMSLPGPSSLKAENLTLENDGQFSLFTRCQDSNGNANTANFVFKYCVEKGPDTTPPLIISTSLLNGMPIAFNQSSLDFEVYINEPATCKWSHLDQNYDKMEETMTCSSSVFEMNAQMLYKCKTTLTGLKDRIENKFYFRCKDQPLAQDKDRNINSESYKFSLVGTQPLYIDSVKPNGTVKDSTESVKATLKIKTSAGSKDGEATCYYSETEEDESYVMFFNTESYEHSQDLYLTEGDYTYYLKCIDLGGNQDTNKTQFKIESDTESPTVARVYHDESYLKIITNEDAGCVYDTTNCNYIFDDGIKMVDIDGKRHYTDWNTKVNFYIKCKDEYSNQPNPNECSIIARPIEIYNEE